MPNVVNISLVPAADVATDATMDFAYPAGYEAAADFSQNNEVLVCQGLQAVLAQAADTFTVSYDADSATVTYKGDTSIPAGTLVTLQIEPVDNFASALVELTDSTTGTASDTLNDTTASVKDDLAALARKVNQLVRRMNLIASKMDLDD